MPSPVPVIVSPLAERDLRAIHQYLAAESPTLADLVYNRLAAAIRSLDRFSRRHPLAPERRFSRTGVRAFTVASHRLYYKIYPERVVILRVWHAARRPPPSPLG